MFSFCDFCAHAVRDEGEPPRHTAPPTADCRGAPYGRGRRAQGRTASSLPSAAPRPRTWRALEILRRGRETSGHFRALPLRPLDVGCFLTPLSGAARKHDCPDWTWLNSGLPLTRTRPSSLSSETRQRRRRLHEKRLRGSSSGWCAHSQCHLSSISLMPRIIRPSLKPSPRLLPSSIRRSVPPLL